jgi:hypothetical protein
MKLKRRVLVALLGPSAFGLAIVGYLGLTRSASSARADESPHSSVPVTAVERVWPSDSVASHPFQYDSVLKIQQNELRARLSGRLVWSEPWQLGNRVARCMRVLSPQALVGSGRDANRSAVGLTDPFILIQGVGQKDEIALSADAPQAAKQMFVGIAGALAFPTSAMNGATNVLQTDASGPYRANYHVALDGALVKEKLSYEDAGLDVMSSRTTFRFENQLLAAVDHVENLAQASFSMDFSTRLRVQSANGTDPLPRACQGRLPDGYQVYSLDKASELDPADAAKYAPRQKFGDAFAALKKTDRASFDPKTFVEVRADLRMNSSDLSAVVKVIEATDEYSPAAAELLASVETKDSLRLLEALLRNGSQEIVQTVMEALNTHGKVDAGLLEVVRLHMTGSNAELSRGAVQLFPSLLQRLEHDQNVDYAGEVERYVVAAKSCSTAEICGAYAQGLVSISNEGARDQLARLARHSDPKVRWSVAVALELLDEPKLDPALVKLVAEEHSEGVKRRAIRACGFRGSETCLVTLRTVLRDGNDMEKAAAMDAIAHGRFPVTEARMVLEKAAEREPIQRIKERIAKRLQEIQQQSEKQK